ncbi:hypothetical protein KVV02_004315 [Mortierella alpina]|uniref:JmjC domain-containing protein n=1 Tax=Mortierella alpina TaxID=64518 RepID=A0A9P8A2V7_MORAP|nr:hypothetical protein KVV02_004315 [Mortierella alpina]
MMQAASIPRAAMQNHVDLAPMHYGTIMARGFPFTPVKRINVNQASQDQLRAEVETICVAGGTPFVLEDWHNSPGWNHTMFTFPHINEIHGNEAILCRDQHRAKDVKLLMKDYIRQVHADSLPLTPTSVEAAEDTHMASTPITKIGSHPSAAATTVQSEVPSDTQVKELWEPLLYAKDVTCPERWRINLMESGTLPQFLAYMRENDLNTLNEHAAENLMIYIGQAGTWTPAHIDQCGAIGHNIMVWAGKDSSSIWFMVKAEDKFKAEALWRSIGQPLEYESYFATVDEMAKADFPIYVVEQRIGDFVMVPSQSYHQVVNLGRATIKVSWNRLTANCLKAAITQVLPRYREIGRPEGYRIKMITQSALEAWTVLLDSQSANLPLSKEQFCESFKTVLRLYKTIVEEDWVDLNIMDHGGVKFERPRRLSNAPPAVCDFCCADLWNRQLHCPRCALDNDNYDICTRCFALGRGCAHRAGSMEFVEMFSMRSCQQLYSRAIKAWNHSQFLAGCECHEQLTDDWANGITPSDEKYSFASIAYKRQFMLTRSTCHQCRSYNRHMVSARCSKCWNTYCETCLYAYHDILWKDTESSHVQWECPKCTQQCHCKPCDKKASIKHKVCLRQKRNRGATFTRPGDDQRNRGGVSDSIDRSFAADSMDSDDETAISDSNKRDQEKSNSIREDTNGVSSSKRKCEAGLSKRDVKRRMPSKFKRGDDDTYSDKDSRNSNDQSISHVLGSRSKFTAKHPKPRALQCDGVSVDDTQARDVVNTAPPKKSKLHHKRKTAPDDMDQQQGHSFNELESRLLSRSQFDYLMAFSPRKPLKRPRSQDQ